MKRLLALSLVAAAFAAPAFAQDTDSETVDISGSVSALCVLGAPSESSIDLGELVDTSGVRVGRLTTISNQSVTLPGSFCNFAGSSVTVSATALTAADTSAVQTGFARAVNFTATASGWASADTAATTAASADGSDPTEEVTGDTQSTPLLNDIELELSAFAVPSDNLLVSGGYAGSVTITLAPAAVAD